MRSKPANTRWNHIWVGVLFLASVSAFSHDSQWPQWRGVAGSAVSSAAKYPVQWSESANVRWKTSIEGRGHSSPIVWGNKIFLTTAIEGPVLKGVTPPRHVVGKEEFSHPDWVGIDHRYAMKVFCINRDTGQLVWERTAYEGGVLITVIGGSYASPTPATDGKSVYAFFGSEGLFCYSAHGELKWKVSLGGIRTLGMGVAASPVLYGRLVILQCDEDEGQQSFVVALEKNTGKEIWRTNRKIQVSWATPLIANSGSRDELVTSGNEQIISYDPATGKEFWHCKGLESNAIHTPVSEAGIVIVSAGFPEKRVIAIRLGGSGDISETQRILWRYNKGTAYVPSPILYQGLVYLLSDKGILTCIDSQTGAVRYDNGRIPVPATFMSSPVAFGGKILLTSDDGQTFVIKAGAQHEVLATNRIEEPVYASLALANGEIFIRSERSLYCISTSAERTSKLDR